MTRKYLLIGLLGIILTAGLAQAQEDDVETITLDDDIGKSRDGSKTDDEVVARYKRTRRQ